MNKKIALALVVLVALVVVVAGATLALSSASYKVPWARVTSGGGQAASPSYKLDGGIGQRLATFVIGSSQGVRIDRALFASGGGPAASFSYRLNGIIGQPFSGGASSASYLLEGASWPILAPVVLVLPLAGDASGDGLVDAVDITKVEMIIAGLVPKTPGADANRDGKVNSLDITKVERLIAGLE